jgi:hypothetical protein
LKKKHSRRRPGRYLRAQIQVKKNHPNRIFALSKSRGWTYKIIAEKCRATAAALNIPGRDKTHTGTIQNLALGTQKLTQDWAELLGVVFGVTAAEIFSDAVQVAKDHRTVRVTHALEGGKWRELPPPEQYPVYVLDEPDLRGAQLYAAQIRGAQFNPHAEKSTIVMSIYERRPSDLVDGKRYHVRVTAADGGAIEAIKSLTTDDAGRYWLKPDPHHREWLPIDGTTGEVRVEIIGRVREFISYE